MTIYISDLAKNEAHKSLLEQKYGMTEQVGYIELGMCPECHEPNKNPIKNKKALQTFNENGCCVKCQKIMAKAIPKTKNL